MYKIPTNNISNILICQNTIFVRMSVLIPHDILTSVSSQFIQIKIRDINAC